MPRLSETMTPRKPSSNKTNVEVEGIAIIVRGWRGRGPGPWYLMADKRMSVAREAGVTSRALARTQLQALAKASISVVAPLDYVRPEIAGLVIADFYAWIQATANQAVEVLVPCADFGNLYRRQRDGLWADLGCQPALRLGDTDYHTFEPVDVVAAQGWATVLRSLTQPGRYLVVPRRHCVGRYGEHDGERAFRPALLLHSSIDADNPANIRCVLAASLEPDLPPSRRTAIEVELRRLAGREITTLMPWDVGVTPQITWAAPGSADLECVAVDRGFTVVLSTDIPGFLVLKTLLEHGGLMGSASTPFPGGWAPPPRSSWVSTQSPGRTRLARWSSTGRRPTHPDQPHESAGGVRPPGRPQRPDGPGERNPGRRGEHNRDRRRTASPRMSLTAPWTAASRPSTRSGPMSRTSS